VTHEHPEAVAYEAATPELLAAASRQVALTHSCQPRRPLQCWQYRGADEAFPKWVSEYLIVGSKSVEFSPPDGSDSFALDEDDWIVMYDYSADLVAVYSASEFSEKFLTVAP
jgi:hypothetical protein